MRIISGKLKGRKLCTPPAHEKSIRPTSDRAREALFSILGNRVSNAMVLDLYAGTGAFGLEALSRNAGYVVFIDHSLLALKILKQNISLCISNKSISGELRVIKEDLSNPLSIKKLPKECHAGFDIIFADPPYASNLSLSTLEYIDSSNLLKENGLLIIEEKNKVDLPDALVALQRIDHRIYGGTVFNFYQKF